LVKVINFGSPPKELLIALRGCYPRRVSVIPEFFPVDDNIHREHWLKNNSLSASIREETICKEKADL